MSYRFILAAVDETGAGRHVAAMARDLAARAGARLSLLTSIPVSTVSPARHAAAEAVLADIEASLGLEAGAPVTRTVVRGVPGIEVPRFAEQHGADLIVLGHTPRTQSARLLVGDTADSVARRSTVPCLLLPPGRNLTGEILASVDGSRHTPAVLDAACRLAAAVGYPVHAVTVEPSRSDEARGAGVMVPLARSVQLEATVAAAGARWGADLALDIRQGEIVEEVLAACRERAAAVLVTGFLRGGPPGVMEGGSIARQLVHGSGSAVLTVPI